MHARKPIRTLQLKCVSYGYGDLHLTRSLIITRVTHGRLEPKQILCLPGWTPVDVVIVVVVVVVVSVVVGLVAVVGVGIIFPV